MPTLCLLFTQYHITSAHTIPSIYSQSKAIKRIIIQSKIIKLTIVINKLLVLLEDPCHHTFDSPHWQFYFTVLKCIIQLKWTLMERDRDDFLADADWTGRCKFVKV